MFFIYLLERYTYVHISINIYIYITEIVKRNTENLDRIIPEDTDRDARGIVGQNVYQNWRSNT